jgi:hypothetical protein
MAIDGGSTNRMPHRMPGLAAAHDLKYVYPCGCCRFIPEGRTIRESDLRCDEHNKRVAIVRTSDFDMVKSASISRD